MVDDARIDALVRRAAARLDAAAFDDAAADLDEAARLQGEAGRPGDEARLRHARATALRAAGRLDDAAASAARARELSPDGTPLRVAVDTELGEVRLLQGRSDDAIGCYRRALEAGRSAGLLPVAQAALLRRIALAEGLAGRAAEAARAAAEAGALYDASGRELDGNRARVEAATALVGAGLSGAGAAIASARRAAEAADDQAALAELALLASAQALDARRPDEALAQARAARQHALDGGAVLPYVGAAIAIAELLEVAGDRLGAYESLAVGWVTTGDQVGSDAAGQLFRPRLRALRDRWGAEAFDAVKAEYYAARGRS